MPPHRAIHRAGHHGLVEYTLNTCTSIHSQYIVDAVGIAIIEGEQHRGDIYYACDELVNVFHQVRQIDCPGECYADLL